MMERRPAVRRAVGRSGGSVGRGRGRVGPGIAGRAKGFEAEPATGGRQAQGKGKGKAALEAHGSMVTQAATRGGGERGSNQST